MKTNLRDAVAFTIVRVACRYMTDGERAAATVLAAAADRGDENARKQLLRFSEGAIGRERQRRTAEERRAKR